MGMNWKTEQEVFWAGEFGDEYADRNSGQHLVASNIAMFGDILKLTQTKINSVLEFGANIGLNLIAIRHLLPNVAMSAVEINPKAVGKLRQLDKVTVYETSILDFMPNESQDLVFTKGVLIHINPDELYVVYDLLYHTAKDYICIAEYYNPTPVSISYRGHSQRLFKRDFAGELMERFPDLGLVGYSFVYRRDSHFPQDDITWFLFKKHHDE